MRVSVRTARNTAAAEMSEIYGHYVLHTHVTFDLLPPTVEARVGWLRDHRRDPRHPVLVAELEGVIVGYASSGPYRPRQGYDTTVETTVYVQPDFVGMGVGTSLYDELFARLRGQDVHRAVAGIALPNPASMALHGRLGFREVGRFTDQGRKFGRYWDVAWYEKPLD